MRPDIVMKFNAIVILSIQMTCFSRGDHAYLARRCYVIDALRIVELNQLIRELSNALLLILLCVDIDCVSWKFLHRGGHWKLNS
mgnify:CR=1 FL=1